SLMKLLLLVGLFLSCCSSTEQHAAGPCTNDATQKNDYTNFQLRHLAPAERNDSVAWWRDYMKNNELCGRIDQQTFIHSTIDVVNKICSRDGGYLWKNNLCISKAKFTVTVVTSPKHDNECMNITVEQRDFIYVAVKCENVKLNKDVKCVPVHFHEMLKKLPNTKMNGCVK
uniref:Ribonuclease A-domain domain-containing protein n=1 Tax=Astyanax mexicanus TaxID=7994 RepID=A0A3B1IEH8_ASTMX